MATAEAIGILFGVTKALELSYYAVGIEFDCLQIVNILQVEIAPRNNLVKIVEDVMMSVPRFAVISWSHTPRVANCLAHYLLYQLLMRMFGIKCSLTKLHTLLDWIIMLFAVLSAVQDL